MLANLLPTPGQVGKLLVGLIVIFALADLIGGTSWILSPISSFKNRNAA